MTNADKYLKDEVSIYDFLVNYAKWYSDKHHRLVVTTPIEDFLKDECKPILSEDEKVILKKLRYEKGAYEFMKIGRTELDSEGGCDLILIDFDNDTTWFGEYGHLFKFIQPRRRI